MVDVESAPSFFVMLDVGDTLREGMQELWWMRNISRNLL